MTTLGTMRIVMATVGVKTVTAVRLVSTGWLDTMARV